MQRIEQEHALLARQSPGDAAEIRWMIEELRVSYFAQVLGTAQPVSEKRIRQAMARLAGVGAAS